MRRSSANDSLSAKSSNPVFVFKADCEVSRAACISEKRKTLSSFDQFCRTRFLSSVSLKKWFSGSINFVTALNHSARCSRLEFKAVVCASSKSTLPELFKVEFSNSCFRIGEVGTKIFPAEKNLRFWRHRAPERRRICQRL